MYVALASSNQEAEFRHLALSLLERLCEQGIFRAVSRTSKGGRVRTTFRNLLTLNTVSITTPEETPEPEAKAPEERPEPEARAPELVGDRAAGQLTTWNLPPHLLSEIVAAFQPADLSKSIIRFREILRDRVHCETAAVCLTESLSGSDSGTRLELEEVCVPRDSEEAAPSGIRDRVEENARTVAIPDLASDPGRFRYFGKGVRGSLVVAPLKSEAYVYGTLSVRSSRPHVFDPNAIGLIELVADFEAQLIRGRLELEELIDIDKTTQIYNRRHFDRRLPAEIERSERTGKPMALLIADIDYFKRVNDTLGHAAGDSALRHVARILSESVRPVDIVARYGGEEFGLILPDVNSEGALVVAERVRNNVEMHGFSTGIADRPVWNLTISIGAALYPTDARD
ncbi:MAG: sensor domain-containing diguanylate cyclase, partial [Candidatus Eisenbacteria bacterium]|nr:sensor domain-containing diguanylate cyclase [Candidatus Eisenbacteria bacterium]